MKSYGTIPNVESLRERMPIQLRSAQPRSGRIATRLRMPAFYAVTVAFLGFLVLALGESATMLATSWLPAYEWPAHRVHHVVIGGLITLLVLSVAVQLYRPRQRIGALAFTIIVVGTLTLASVFDEGLAALAELAVFLVPLAIVALLHPGRDELSTAFREVRRVDRRLLGVAAIGALATAAVAAGEFASHVTVIDEHAAFGHYHITGVAMVVVGVAALASTFRPTGWRFLAYGAGFLTAIAATASLAFPGVEQGSALATVAALALLAWVAAFLALSEWVERDVRRDADGTAVRRGGDGAISEGESIR